MPTANAFINELNLKELLKDYNGVIIGASGGAMNMADHVYCIPEVEGEHSDPNFNRYLNGLGLTDINVVMMSKDWSRFYQLSIVLNELK